MRGELCYEASVESEVHEVERGMWRVRGEEGERGGGAFQRGGERKWRKGVDFSPTLFCVVVFR